MPYIKTAHAAGSLALGVQDHWVPGVNAVVEQICTEWGRQNNVAVKVDFITSVGNKLALTAKPKRAPAPAMTSTRWACGARAFSATSSNRSTT